MQLTYIKTPKLHNKIIAPGINQKVDTNDVVAAMELAIIAIEKIIIASITVMKNTSLCIRIFVCELIVLDILMSFRFFHVFVYIDQLSLNILSASG